MPRPRQRQRLFSGEGGQESLPFPLCFVLVSNSRRRRRRPSCWPKIHFASASRASKRNWCCGGIENNLRSQKNLLPPSHHPVPAAKIVYFPNSSPKVRRFLTWEASIWVFPVVKVWAVDFELWDWVGFVGGGLVEFWGGGGMYIEELEEGGEGSGGGDGKLIVAVRDGEDVGSKKRVLVGVGARFLFYPTLLYNVVRNRMETAFHWWDEVNEYLLLGAVPFPTDVLRLKELGVHGVVTLNEPYETLVPMALYHAHGIENLVIPTRDYLFAPSFGNICQAVDFIHKNASCGKTTYVHCKAGRGRSTTVVLCYLVQHKQMTPTAAYEHVRLRRPRVHLAASQWQAVQEYYHLRVKKMGRSCCLDNTFTKISALMATRNLMAFDDSSFVVISEADLDGYDADQKSVVGNDMWVELSVVYRMQFAGQVAFARLSRFWFRQHAPKEIAVCGVLGRDACSLEVDQSGYAHPYLLTGMAVEL